MEFKEPNYHGAEKYLLDANWTNTMISTLLEQSESIALRFVIIDNSYSMIRSDGYRLSEPAEGRRRLIPCTRWDELKQTISFHSGLAEAGCFPTQYVILNGGKSFLLGTGEDGGQGRRKLMEALNEQPTGETPLCTTVASIIKQIQKFNIFLESCDKKACIIIATDGEASDGDLGAAMTSLQSLPVFVVIRLCTSEEKVAIYWNSLDNYLETHIDVIDDLVSEAQEVARVNSWLTYGEPLHRLREFGVTIEEMDLIDEKPFDARMIRAFCVYFFFDGERECVPNPEEDWPGFIAALEEASARLPTTFNFLKKKEVNWVCTKHIPRPVRRRGSSSSGGAGRKGHKCVIM